MAQGQVIGVLGAVVAAGLGYYYFTKREETVETTTPVETTETTEVVKETSALDEFSSANGSLYPEWGSSNIMRDVRESIVGSEACAQACFDDPDCVAFTHWEERYDVANPEGTKTHPSYDKCYFWGKSSAPKTPSSWTGATWKGGSTASQAVGPSHEYLKDRVSEERYTTEFGPDWEKSKARTYWKKTEAGFKYTDLFNEDGTPKETQANSAEEVVAPDYTPLDYRPLSDSVQFDPRSKSGNCF
jgi:hypothetical protein